jgi:hypothetical protein
MRALCTLFRDIHFDPIFHDDVIVKSFDVVAVSVESSPSSSNAAEVVAGYYAGEIVTCGEEREDGRGN